ncbi:MAG: hypothetical protein AAF677_06175 [Pseudomonadota bacterium]
MFEFAWAMILGTPVIAAFVFARFPLQQALCLVVIGGYLFLPIRPSIELPALPDINKHTLPLILGLLFCYAAARGKGWTPEKEHDWGQNTWLPRSQLGRTCLVLLLLAVPIGTYLTNRDYLPLPDDRRALGYADMGTMFYKGAMIALAVLLGRRFLSDPPGQRTLLMTLALLGLLYCVPVLMEARLAPQTNIWVYGFNNVNWASIRRYGGFRPQVFLESGLDLAAFMATAFVAAIACVRHIRDTRRSLWLLSVMALFVGLVLMLSLGALALGLGLGLAMFFLSRRAAMWLVAGISVFVLLYPMARVHNVVPTQTMVAAAELVHARRADSLEFRFRQEDLIMTKAKRRPVFGWGIWSRGKTFDPVRGREVIVDSYFILIWSQFGWAGYIAIFGLLTFPIIMIAWRREAVDPDFVTVGLAMVACVMMLDQLINASSSNITWLLCGSLLGRAERGLAKAQAQDRRAAAALAKHRPRMHAIGDPVQPDGHVLARKSRTGSKRPVLAIGARDRARAALAKRDGQT